MMIAMWLTTTFDGEDDVDDGHDDVEAGDVMMMTMMVMMTVLLFLKPENSTFHDSALRLRSGTGQSRAHRNRTDQPKSQNRRKMHKSTGLMFGAT